MARKPILHLLVVTCFTFVATALLIWLLFPANAQDEAVIAVGRGRTSVFQQNDVQGDYLLGVGKADITGYS